MERNKLEDLFKNKLEGFALEPSNEARDRFQELIQLKRRKVLIRRIGIAASVLLFTFTGIYSLRTLKTDKIDLTDGESFDAGNGTEMAIIDEVPDPGLLYKGVDKKTISDSEMVNNMKSSVYEDSSVENMKPDNSGSYAIINQGIEDEKFKSEINNQDYVAVGEEYDQLIEERAEESTYIEYFVADPDIVGDEQSKDMADEDQVHEPMKITIEYIASGNKDTQSESKRSNFYSKLDNMKTMNEVLGDLRSYKDRLFALDFKKEEKVNNEEKSKE